MMIIISILLMTCIILGVCLYDAINAYETLKKNFTNEVGEFAKDCQSVIDWIQEKIMIETILAPLLWKIQELNEEDTCCTKYNKCEGESKCGDKKATEKKVQKKVQPKKEVKKETNKKVKK